MLEMFLVVILAADSINSDIVEPAAGPGAKVPLETVKGGDPKNAPGPVAPSPVAVFEIDNELFGKLVESQSVAAPAPLKMVVYSRRYGCPPCDRLHDEVREGDADVQVEYRYEDQFPAWMRLRPTPLIHCPSTNTYLEGYHPFAEIKRRFHVVSAPQARPALAGGTFDTSLVEKYLKLVAYARIDARLPTQAIEIPGVNLELTGGTVAVVHNQGVTRLTFGESLPTVKYGFLAIEVSGVVYNAGTLTAQLKSFPDVTFRGR